MPHVVRQLAWSSLAVVAFVVALLLDRLVSAPAADVQPGPELFLAGQKGRDSRVQLRVDGASVHLAGTLMTTLDGRAPERIAFLLDPSLTVSSVRIGDAVYERHRPAIDDVLAVSRDRNLFRCAGPRPEGDGPHRLEIRYHGSALALSRTSAERPIPLVLVNTTHYVPRLAAEAEPLAVEISLPEDWGVWTDRPVEAQSAAGSHAQFRLPADKLPAALVLGELHETMWHLAKHSVRAVSRNPELLSTPVERALDQVQRFLPDLLPGQLNLVLVPGLEPPNPVHVEGNTWLLPEPTSNHQWVEGLAYIARTPVLEAAPALREVHKAIALMSLPTGATELFDAAMREYRKRPGFQEVQAWVALARMTGGPAYLEETLRGWIGRWRADPQKPPEGPLFAELTARKTFEWISPEPGVDVRVGPMSVRTAGNRVELHGEVLIDPAPPKVHGLPALELLVVYSDRSEVVEIANLQGRTPVTLKNLLQRPLRVVVDPSGRYPDRDRLNNAASLDGPPEPATFAVTRDSSLLAITPAVGQGAFPSGLYVYDLTSEQPTPPVWHELPGRVLRLRWVEPERVLFLTYEGRSRQPVHCVFHWEEGRLRRFPESAEPGPDGHAVLLHSLRVPGRYRHGCYWLGTRYEVPFLNEYGGRLRWVDNANLLVAGQDDGHGAILDLSGRLVADLGLAAQEVRDVLSTPYGYTFVTDGAHSSRLQLIDPQGRPLTLFPFADEHPTGRILGYFLSVDPSFFYVFLAGDAGQYSVVRFNQQGTWSRLYEGRDRPLANLHSLRGVILAAGEGRSNGPLSGLSFSSYDRDREDRAPPLALIENVFLEPSPVLASEGRFLYYIRADQQPARLPAEHRTRAIYRYDFLTEREDSLFTGRGG